MHKVFRAVNVKATILQRIIAARAWFKETGLPWLVLSMVVLILDQLSKQWIVHNLAVGESIELVPFFSLSYTHNYGAAFGMLSHEGGWQRWFFIVLALSVTLFVMVWLARLSRQERITALGLSLLLGGAMGNLIDRIVYGFVIDFCHFHIGDWSWYIFNLADVAICFGAMLLLFGGREN